MRGCYVGIMDHHTSPPPSMSQVSTPATVDQEPGLGPESTAPTSNLADATTWSAGATLVFGALVYYLSTRRSELTSELLCWVLLPIVFSVTKRSQNVQERAGTLPVFNASADPSENASPPSISLWVAAICIVISSAFRAERSVIVLFPALVLLLTIGQRHLRPGHYPPLASHMSLFPFLTHNIIGVTLTAVFGIAALSEWDPLEYAISVAPVAALFVVYTLLTPQSQIGSRSRWLRSFNIETAAWSLSLRVVFILVLILGRETYLIGFPDTSFAETLTSGLAKALTWYFASQLARSSSWLVSTMASTFSLLATRDPFSQQTDTRALITVVASLISLGQTVYMLPKQAKGKLTLCALALIPLLPYFANLATIQLAKSSAVVHIEKHPVEALIREAKANLDDMLAKQSTTYSAAYDEYQRRYGFEPPHGFEEWYKFAKSHNSPIIDEFDMISEAITPFMKLSGKEVLDMMSQAYNEPDHELWSCSTYGQPAKTQCSHHGRENDRNNAQFFDKITRQIPSSFDLKFLLNHLDEPTVLIPPYSSQEPGALSLINTTDLGGKRAWETLTQFCSSRKVQADPQRKPPIETYGLPFVTDRKAAMDPCEHIEYGEMHGLFAAPESLRIVQGLVPVLSTGAPSTMGDILYPSTAYVEEERFRYHSENDVDWEQKQNNLYWAGSTTGGHGREGQWHQLHRQRFVELAQNLGRRRFSYLVERDGAISRSASSFLNGRLYDVAFTNVLQCDAAPCRAQGQHFRNKAWATGDRPFRSRLVFDADGNGISGRYYKLLASRSAPLKQTLFREWHDDRLVPWAHYVPVSQAMDELPELVAFLTSTEPGRARAREIADRGRAWFARAFREVDIVIYMYRLLLELTRLQDPDRPASQIGVE